MMVEGGADPDSVLRLAGDCGRLVLENGGETYRAEECMTALASAYGGADPECFATPTGAMFSMSDGSGRVYTLIIRIKRRAMDFGALVKLNDIRLDAAAGRLGFREARALADQVAASPPPRAAALLSGAAIVASFFCLLFGGGWREALVAGSIGIVLKLLLDRLARGQVLSDFFASGLGGAVSAFLAGLARAFLPGISTGPIIIGVLMLLVPGVVIVNAIRDLMAGDLVAGVARGADAFMSAAAISLGTAGAIRLAAFLPGAA